jgi:hypothetical protein
MRLERGFKEKQEINQQLYVTTDKEPNGGFVACEDNWTSCMQI